MKPILQYFQTQANLSSQELQLLEKNIQFAFFNPKEIVLQPNQLADCIYFVQNGFLRSYYKNQNDTDFILHLAPSGWWITDMAAFLTNTKANLFIEALLPSEIAFINHENLNNLYLQIPKLERLFRILAENSLVAHQERLIDNLSLSAQQRFEKLVKKFPNILQQIPQKHIASYLGVTPEFFSKMKAIALKNKSITS